MTLLSTWLVALAPISADASNNAEAATRIKSPFRVLSEETNVTQLTIDPDRYAQIGFAPRLKMLGFPIGSSRKVDLDLSRMRVFAEDAVLVLETAEGPHALPTPDVVLLSGHVTGHPDSRVFLSLSPFGNQGIIRIETQSFILSQGRNPGGPCYVYNATDLPVESMETGPFRCTTPPPTNRESNPGGAPRGNLPCRVAQVAVDTDWEFSDTLFNGDTAAAAAYATTLLAAVSVIYQDQLNTTLEISFLRVWQSDTDPWGASLGLGHISAHWNSQMGAIQRDTVHLLTPRFFGGAANLAALCDLSRAYGYSAGIEGAFPVPFPTEFFDSYDPLVVAHEIGHNFGAPHVWDLVPPVLDCTTGNCPNGTIMGICSCNSQFSARRVFHQRAIDETILPYLENAAPCNLEVPCVVCTPGDVNEDGFVTGDDIGGYVRAKLGQPAMPGENQACADLGTGTLNGDTLLFVDALLN